VRLPRSTPPHDATSVDTVSAQVERIYVDADTGRMIARVCAAASPPARTTP